MSDSHSMVTAKRLTLPNRCSTAATHLHACFYVRDANGQVAQRLFADLLRRGGFHEGVSFLH
jgi:hypothetical protein